MWAVPPTKAVAVTITKFVVEPLEHIGLGLKRFMLGMLEDVPFVFNGLFLSFAIFLVVLVLVLSFGYKIKLVHLLDIEPGHQRYHPRLRELEKKVHFLESCANISSPENVNISSNETFDHPPAVPASSAETSESSAEVDSGPEPETIEAAPVICQTTH